MNNIDKIYIITCLSNAQGGLVYAQEEISQVLLTFV